MKLELKERDTLTGAAIKGDVVITMSPDSIVMGCRFEGDVTLKTMETRGKITYRTPLFWQNFIIGHFTCEKNAKVWIRENVSRDIEV